jgi:hypothetical protein
LHNLPPHQKYKDNLYKIKIYLKNTFKTRKKRVFNFWWMGTYIILPLFLVFLSFLSILWSQNVSIAIFRSIKLLEFYLLYIYIIFRIVPRGTIFTSPNPSPYKGEGGSEHSLPLNNQNVPRGTFDAFFWIIILSGLIQAIIGIIQFFLQKSIGLFWLRESLISPDILGVAKVILNGEKYVRAYGLMPHPNVLGGFLLFSVIITFSYKKLFHACPPKNCSTWNNFGWVEQIIAPFSLLRRRVGDEVHYRWIFRLILTIQLLALILTFSKSAIIGLLIAIIFIYTPFSFIRRRAGDEVRLFHMEQKTPHPNLLLIKEKELNVPRGTFLDGWNNFGKMKQFRFIILSALIILLSTFIIIRPNLDSLLFNSLNERLFYLNVPRGTFESDPIFGLGAGQSVLSMQKYFPQKLEFWQYQPVHNVFLLILSELGLIGSGLFIWWLWKFFHACPPEKCSTRARQKNVPRGTFNTPFSLLRRRVGDEVGGSKDDVKNNDYILHNDNTYLSSIIISKHFQGILLGLIFIMLFDHYLWDIQQGSLIFWLTAGFIAGINRK